jgi:hypothetical protein
MSFDNSPAMTAPGSIPVTPLPEYMDEPYGVPEPGAVPGPQASNATQIEVNTTAARWQHAQDYAPFGAASPGGWVQASDDSGHVTEGWEVS